MIKGLPTMVMAGILSAGMGLCLADPIQENQVTTGPGYVKGQQSQKTLAFVTPHGWAKDENAAKKLGFYCVLVPDGMKLENANKVITIAFQTKDPNKPELKDLKSFVRSDLQDTLAQFPGAQFERWQPSRLDPSKINYWSIEIYGKEKNKPSPQRYLIVDAGDGYFSISLTTGTRDELQLPVYEDFFNTLNLTPRS